MCFASIVLNVTTAQKECKWYLADNGYCAYTFFIAPGLDVSDLCECFFSLPETGRQRYESNLDLLYQYLEL